MQEPHRYRENLATKPPNSFCFPNKPITGGPRVAIFASKTLDILELQQFPSRDSIAACINDGESKTIVASLYMDILKPVKQEIFTDLLSFVKAKNLPLVLAIDSNAHSTLFGPDQNSRGD